MIIKIDINLKWVKRLWYKINGLDYCDRCNGKCKRASAYDDDLYWEDER